MSVWLTVSKSVLSLNLAWLPGGVYAAPLVCKHTTIHIHGELKKRKKESLLEPSEIFSRHLRG